MDDAYDDASDDAVLSMDPAHGEGAGLAARSTGVERNSRSPVDRRGGAFGDGVNSASCSAREGDCRCEGYSTRSASIGSSAAALRAG